MGEQNSNWSQLSGANSANIRGVRSEAYLTIRERRTTKKIRRIRPPLRGSRETADFFVAPPRSSVKLHLYRRASNSARFSASQADSSSNSALSGYIAITTTIILSLVMLVLAITLGSGTFLTRSGTVDFSNKKTSHFLAISCLEYARLKSAQNSNYSGNETLTIGSSQCSILPVETSGLNKIIKTRAQIMGATTNLKLIADASTLSTVSLEEAVKF